MTRRYIITPIFPMEELRFTMEIYQQLHGHTIMPPIAYNYNYDGLSRLFNCSVIADNCNPKYEEAFDYDKHGNITGLFRTNQTGWTIDLLTMAYDGNQLKKISDEYGSQNKYNVKEYNDLAALPTNSFTMPMAI